MKFFSEPAGRNGNARSPDRLGQQPLFQQVGEERLREILRVVRRVAEATDVSVERIPVAPAERLQRAVTFRAGLVPARNTTLQCVWRKSPASAGKIAVGIGW